MISGAIDDSQLTSSSVYPAEWDAGCAERNARVYLPNRLAWCARYKSASEWLQVDLGVLSKVVNKYDNFVSMTAASLLQHLRGGPKNFAHYCMQLQLHQILTTFQNFFTVGIGIKFVITLSVKDLTTPRLCRYTTL